MTDDPKSAFEAGEPVDDPAAAFEAGEPVKTGTFGTVWADLASRDPLAGRPRGETLADTFGTALSDLDSRDPLAGVRSGATEDELFAEAVLRVAATTSWEDAQKIEEVSRLTGLAPSVVAAHKDAIVEAWQRNSGDTRETLRKHPWIAQLLKDRPHLLAPTMNDKEELERLDKITQAFRGVGAVVGAHAEQDNLYVAPLRALLRNHPGVSDETKAVGGMVLDAANAILPEPDGLRSSSPMADALRDTIETGELDSATTPKYVRNVDPEHDARTREGRAAGPLGRIGMLLGDRVAGTALSWKGAELIFTRDPEKRAILEAEIADEQAQAARRDYGGEGVELVAQNSVDLLASQATQLAGAAGGGALGAGVGLATGLVTKKPGTALRLAKTGAKVGATLSIAPEILGGNYIAFREAKAPGGVRPSEVEAIGGAVVTTVASMLIESASFGATERSLGPLGRALQGKLGSRAAGELLKDQSFRALAKEIGTAQAQSAGTEPLEELVDAHSTAIGEWLMRSVAEGSPAAYDRHAVRMEGWEAFGRTLGGTLTTGGIAGSVKLGGSAVLRAAFADGNARDAAVRSGALADGIRELGKGKLGETSPAAAAELVANETAAGGSMVETVYVDAEAVVRYFQEHQDVDPTTILGPDAEKRLKEALGTGKRLEIPVSEYLSAWSRNPIGDALAEHTTTRPNVDTRAQISEAAIKEAAARLPDPTAGSNEERATQGWMRQLVDTGTVKLGDAKAQVQILRLGVRHGALRAGLDPEVVFAEMAERLSIAGSAPKAETRAARGIQNPPKPPADAASEAPEGAAPGASAETPAGSPRAAPQASAAATPAGSSETRVITPQRPQGERATYRVIEADDLLPSHDAETFAPSAAYPEGVQEREYHRQPEEQAKVVLGAAQLNPALLLSDTPSAVDGPPLVAAGKRALVLGGNGRSMMLRRAMKDPAVAARYNEALRAKAPAFGIDPATLDGMKAPVLVRVLEEVDSEGDTANLVAAVRRTNEGMTQALSPKARAVAEARTMTPGTIAAIAELLAADPDATLRDLMRDKPQVLVEILRRDGIINQQNVSAWVAGGNLTDEAKDRLEGMFLGRAVGSGDRLAATAPALLAKLERAAPHLLRVAGINPEADVTKLVQAAIDAANDAKRRGISLRDLAGQGTMFGDGPDRDAVRLAEILTTSTQRDVASRFKRWADLAAYDPRQGSLFGAPPSPAEAKKALLAPGEPSLTVERTKDGGAAVTYEQPAFHGSPHRFEGRFKLTAIGTGEGGQAFGWGLYFAEERTVAENYRRALSGHQRPPSEARFLTPAPADDVAAEARALVSEAARDRRDNTTKLATKLQRKEILEKVIADVDYELGAHLSAIHRIESARSASVRVDEEKLARHKEASAKLEKLFAALRAIKADDFEVVSGEPGQIYSVDLPENDELLDWEAPLAEQPPKVQAALRKLGYGRRVLVRAKYRADDPGDETEVWSRRLLEDFLAEIRSAGGTATVEETDGWADADGASLYRLIADELGSEKSASEALRDAGVPGLRFLDRASRGKGEGTHNFVIWDESRISEPTTYYQSVSLREGKESLNPYGIDPEDTPRTREVARALEARQREKYGTIARDDHSEATAKRIARWMVKEIEFELRPDRRATSGAGWYSEKWQAALTSFGELFPELRTDKAARDVFTLLVAITSDGQKVATNMKMALALYGRFRHTKRLEPGIVGTNRAAGLDANLERINGLLERHGSTGIHEYLLREATVEELRAMAREAGEKLETEYLGKMVLPVSAVVLGPKLGAFYANLMGATGYLTMDRWWSRTFNRYRGQLLPTPTKSSMDALRERLGDPTLTDEQVLEKARELRKVREAKGFKDPTDAEKSANTIFKAAFDELEDTPFNGSDREFMWRTAKHAQKMLAKRGVEITIADIQATLWYYEKRLYAEQGARASADVSYEETARRLITQSKVADLVAPRLGVSRPAAAAYIWAKEDDLRERYERRTGRPGKDLTHEELAEEVVAWVAKRGIKLKEPAGGAAAELDAAGLGAAAGDGRGGSDLVDAGVGSVPGDPREALRAEADEAAALAEPEPPPPPASRDLSRRVVAHGILTPEQRAEVRGREFGIDPVSGLWNGRSFAAVPVPKGMVVAAITTTDAKPVNDHPTAGGHEVTNDLFAWIGHTLAEGHPEAARGGTNFYIFVPKRGAKAALEAELARLRATVGQRVSFVGGLGPAMREATKAMDDETARLRKKGDLPARGLPTPGLDVPSMNVPVAEPLRRAPPAELVAQVADLSPEDYFNTALVKDGVLTAEGRAALPRKKYQLATDLKGLGQANIDFGRGVGDEMIRVFKEAVVAAGGSDFNAAHLSGDEFAFESDDPGDLRRFRDALAKELDGVEAGGPVLDEHGKPTGKFAKVPVGFRAGIGRTYGEADRDINARRRAEAGDDRAAQSVAAREADLGLGEGAWSRPARGVPQAFDHAGSAPAAGDGSAAGRVEQTAFRKWFGDSKVVDADGKPLVVYHGTTADFSSFTKTSDVLGFHFGARSAAERRLEDAKREARHAERETGEARLLPVFLAIQNPLRLRDLGDWAPADVANELVRVGALRPESDLFDDLRLGDRNRERLVEHLRGLGYDGIVYENETEGGGDSYIAFDSQQVKSATDNRGTFDPASPNIYFQADEPQNLVVQHNLSTAKFLHAVELGALPAPSLAVARKEHPLENFGEITLLGPPRLADPATGTPVFDADAYTPRWPRSKLGTNAPAAKALRQAVQREIDQVGSGYLDLEEIIAEYGDRAHEESRKLERVLMLAFLRERGVAPELPRSKPDVAGRNDLLHDGLVEAVVRDLPDPVNPMAVGLEKVADAALRAARRYWGNVEAASTSEADKQDARSGLRASEKFLFDDDGSIRVGNVDSIAYAVARHVSNAKRGRDVDIDEADSLIRRTVGAAGLDAEFQAWAREKMRPALGDRYIPKRTPAGKTRAIPYTLVNILKELTREIRAGEGFNYGLGSARARGAKKFRSLEQIKKARSRITSREEFNKERDALSARMDALESELRPYSRGSLHANLVEAISESYKRGHYLSNELRLSGFDGVPWELVQKVGELAVDLVELPTEYFEAKPQRIVDFSEFKAAVVPRDVDPKVLEELASFRIPVETYDRDVEGSRAEAIRRAGEAAQVFFQEKEPAPPFFSAVARALETAKQAKAQPKDWLAIVSKAPGVRKEEVEFLGLAEWLGSQKGQVAREDVLEYVREHEIEIKIKELGDKAFTYYNIEDYRTAKEAPGSYREILFYAPGSGADHFVAPHFDEHGVGLLAHARVTQHAIDGAPVLMIDEIQSDLHQLGRDKGYVPTADAAAAGPKVSPEKEELDRRFEDADTAAFEASGNFMRGMRALGVPDRAMQAILSYGLERAPRSFFHPAFRENAYGALPPPGVNERAYRKPELSFAQVLEEEEKVALENLAYAKRDWSGHPRDVRGDMKQAAEEAEQILDWIRSVKKAAAEPEPVSREQIAEREDLAALRAAFQQAARVRSEAAQARAEYAEAHPEDEDAPPERSTVAPDAPFKTSWDELAAKRLIRYAAESGVSRVAWATSQTQVERYDLRKRVRQIDYNPELGLLMAWPKDSDGDHFSWSEVNEEKLEDIVGKRLAKRLLAPEARVSGDGYRSLHGDDLDFGHEGMEFFYDNRLPQIMRGIGKKFGAKVTKQKLDGVEGLEAEVWTMDLPDELLDLALNEGFPVFQPKDKPASAAPGASDRTVEQKKKQARGYMERAGRSLRVTLTPKANLSTFLHETGHVFLELYGDLAEREGTTPEFRQDYETLLGWLGVKSRGEIKAEHHEKFARGFEAYLREGNAPSPSLASTFARFRSWLMRIYRDASELRVELSDEVREVFGRMLATDEEIESAKARMGARPLFRTAEEAGMTPEDFQRYLEHEADATSFAARRADLAQAKDKLRRLNAWWQEELEKQTAEADREYEDLPARRAWLLLRGQQIAYDGTLTTTGKPLALDHAAVVEVLGEEKARRYKTAARGGVRPGELAEIVGFPDGASMLRAVDELPPKSEWVKARAQERMEALHPDAISDRTILREVVERGMHSAKTLKWLLAEWRMLGRRGADKDPRDVPAEAMKRDAEAAVGKVTVGKLSPRTVLGRERRLAQQAAIAAAKGQYELAQVRKLQQVFAHFEWAATDRARDDREKFLDDATRLRTKESRAKIGKTSPVYRDGIDQILEAVGLLKVEGRDQPPASFAQVVAELEANAQTIAFDPAAVQAILDGRVYWAELTVDQMRELMRAIKAIRTAERELRTVIVDGKKVEREATIQALLAEAKMHGEDVGALPSTESASYLGEILKAGVATFDGMLRKPEEMLLKLGGGSLASTWFRAIVLPLQQAKHREADLTKRLYAPLLERFASMPAAVRRSFNDPIDGDALFPTHLIDGVQDLEAPRRKYELLMMLYHAGTESSLERLLVARNISEAQLRAAVEKHLSREELEWVQSLWDASESLWPEVRALEERDTGLAPPKLPHRPFPTKFDEPGKPPLLRGGYAPAVYDRRVEIAGEKQQARALAEIFDPSFTRPATSHSHTKSRVENFTGVLSLEPALILAGYQQVIHDLAYREPLKSIGKLALDKRVQGALKRFLGDGRARQILPWLKDIGQMRANDGMVHASLYNKAIKWTKAGTVLGAIGYSLPTFLGDMSNFLAAVPGSELQAKHYAAGLAEFLRSPFAVAEAAHAKSGELRTRRGKLQRELGIQIRDLTKSGVFVARSLRWIQDHAFALLEASDWMTSTPAWVGAYRQALAAGKSDEDAVIFADSVLRQLFPSHAPVDAAAVLRDKGVVGALLLFYGFFSVVYNVQARKIDQVLGAKSKATAAKRSGELLAFLLAVGAAGEFLAGRGPEEGDGDEPDERILRWAARKTLAVSLASIPGGGDLAGWLEAKALGKPRITRDRTLAGFFSGAGEALLSIGDDEKDLDKKVAGILRGLAPFVRLPAAQPIRTGQYVADVAAGEREPRDPFDAASGLVYGERDDQAANPLSVLSDLMSGD